MSTISGRMAHFAITVIALGLLSCNNKAANPPGGDTSPNGDVTSHTSCKGGSLASATIAIPNNQDCIEYSYDGQSVLLLKHVNAGFNCCPDSLTADFQIASGEIIIDEAEFLTNHGCSCLCLFDLEFQISNLPPGLYHIRVNEKYLQSGANLLAFTLNLKAGISGDFCVTRDFYPWGE